MDMNESNASKGHDESREKELSKTGEQSKQNELNSNKNNGLDNPEVSSKLSELFLRKESFTDYPSPHIKSSETTTAIMADVIIACIPSLIWGICVFGFRALTLTLISVASCVLFELIYQLILRRPLTAGDLSAVVTGVLLAFSLPVNVPLWIPVIGAAFAIIVVKQLFGGIGKNIVNPAIAARIFLAMSFPQFMSVFYDISAEKLSPFEVQSAIDAVIGATPLNFLKEGLMPSEGGYALLDMFLGQKSGCIGEVSVVLLIAGGVYLMIRRVITWHIPISFIGIAAVLTYLLPKNPDMLNFCLNEIFAGGLFLGAFFMATDYVTSPITKSGRLIFGAGCGFITVFIRYFGIYPEGVSFAIMIMNLFVWYIDRFTKPVKFGGYGNGGQKQEEKQSEEQQEK